MSRILIAEDEERIVSFLEKGLRANGFATDVATDGEEALRLARSGEFDLLILDLGLPVKNGFDVLRQLRDENRRLPVVILTARDTVGDTIAGLKYVARRFVADCARAERIRHRRFPSRLRMQLSLAGGSVDAIRRVRRAEQLA